MRRRGDTDSAELARGDPTLSLQVRVSRLLGLGFALSVSLIGGFGSLASLVIGLRARRLIKESGGEVAGMKMAWWCIIAGACGAAAVLPFIVRLLIEAANE